jgi:hypothetical protein
MSRVLEDRLPQPESKSEITKWNPFPGEEALDEGEIASEGDESRFEQWLDTL